MLVEHDDVAQIMFQSAIVFGLLLKSITAYSKCSTSDAKGPIEIPIKFELTPEYTPVRLAGKIVIHDGCSVSRAALIIVFCIWPYIG